MGIFLRSDSQYYWMDFKLDSKKQIRCSTRTKDRKLALQIYHTKRSEYQKIEHGFDRKKIKLSELMNDYLGLYSKHNKLSYSNDVLAVNRMCKFFSTIMAHELTTEQIEQYRIKRLSTVSKSTVNRDMSLLKHIFNKGIEWGKITSNPVEKIKFYSEKENKRIRYLEKNEKIKLLGACALPTKRLVFFALSTGMRQGEILNLKWSDIDFNTRLIKISHSKAGKIRYVNIPSDLENMLKSTPTISEYVFGTPKGKAKFSLYRKPFIKAIKNCGLSGLHFHDLRHDYASTLVMKGVDIKTVSELLGHSTLVMTERYSHLSKEHKQAAVELLPKGLFYHAGITLDKNENLILAETS
ncbi:MAG: site-specific integrase [Elusimicrobia bacterium]|nr:site-specific integrase [Elusimicrobiota bacterium]